MPRNLIIILCLAFITSVIGQQDCADAIDCSDLDLTQCDTEIFIEQHLCDETCGKCDAPVNCDGVWEDCEGDICFPTATFTDELTDIQCASEVECLEMYTVVTAAVYGGTECAHDHGEVRACAGIVTCESCTDGIQNQDEEGIDCGGVCKECVAPTGCTCVEASHPDWGEIPATCGEYNAGYASLCYVQSDDSCVDKFASSSVPGLSVSFCVPANLMNGEEVCESHAYTEDTCSSIGCCYWDNDECHSDVGTDACCPGTWGECEPHNCVEVFSVPDGFTDEGCSSNVNDVRMCADIALCEAAHETLFEVWSEWTECSVDCGSGAQARTRECAGAPSTCRYKGLTTDVRNCDAGSCSSNTLDKGWVVTSIVLLVLLIVVTGLLVAVHFGEVNHLRLKIDSLQPEERANEEDLWPIYDDSDDDGKDPPYYNSNTGVTHQFRKREPVEKRHRQVRFSQQHHSRRYHKDPENRNVTVVSGSTNSRRNGMPPAPRTEMVPPRPAGYMPAFPNENDNKHLTVTHPQGARPPHPRHHYQPRSATPEFRTGMPSMENLSDSYSDAME